MKKKITVQNLVAEAKVFCEQESQFENKDLFGVTDGKAVGTFIEHKLTEFLKAKYAVTLGSSANELGYS